MRQDGPGIGHKLDQSLIVGKASGSQLGNESLIQSRVVPDRPVIPAMVNMGVAEASSGADNRAMLRIAEERARSKVLGEILVILKILLVTGDPDGYRWMIANISNVIVIKSCSPQGETRVVGVPGF